MVKRKKIFLILLVLLLNIILSLFCFIFFLVIGIDKYLTFFISMLIFVFLFLCFLLAFSFLKKIFSDVKNELKILEVKEKAVRDFYRYDQFLNPPDIDN